MKEPQYLMNNPNARPEEKRNIIPLKEEDLTKDYYKLIKGRRWIPRHGWNIEQGQVKRIPKRELQVVPEFYEKVPDYVPENEKEKASDKKMVEVNAGGKIENTKREGYENDIFKKYGFNIDLLMKGDSDEELRLKNYGIMPEEIQTMVCNKTGKVFGDREQFFRHKLKLYDQENN